MGCPAENTLLGYVGGILDDGSVEEVERHLDGCSSCRFLFAELARRDDAGLGDDRAAGGDVGGPAGALPLDLANPLDLPTGAVVGRYVIVGLQGRGGMGVVYKAFDPELDRTIALKLVGAAGLGLGRGRGADEARLRLAREARALAQLSHPNVVAVHDVGTFEGDVFLAMEFVAGRTLRAWLRERPARPREVLAVHLAAGAGLAAAHRVGIVHRDFKPENVMIGDDGRVRVLDFGLARSSAPAADDSAGAARPPSPAPGCPGPALTREGAIVGTPGYMAPEQDRGDEVDARSDQFSFCASLFEALYGRLPFEGATYREMAGRRMAGEVTAPPAQRGLSARARRAILRGLRAAPDERHPDMSALLAELDPRPRVVRRRIAAALALVAIASTAWALWVRASAGPGVDETCAAASADAGRVWNGPRREALARSFAATGHPRAAEIAGRASAALDGWTREWQARRVELCELPMRRGPVAERFAADRLQCLERRLGGVDALVTAYIDAASRELVEDAIGAVGRLDRPASCDELVVGNATEAQKQEWKPAMIGLVQARLALAAGRLDETVRLAGEVAAQSRSRADPEPLCAALMLLGQAQARQRDAAGARTSLRGSIRACTEVREESLAADAWLELVSLAFLGGHDDAALEDTIFGAELAVLRLPPDDLRGAELAYRVGTVRYLRGDYDRALAELGRARARWAAAGAEAHRLELAAVDNSLGLVHVHRAAWDDALAAFERARAAWKAAGPAGAVNAAVTDGNIGTMLLVRRRYSAAEPLMRRQLAALEALGEAGRASMGDALVDLGMLYALGDRCGEAEPLLARGLAATIDVEGEGAVLVSVALAGQGLCQLARGASRAAVTTLERARAIATGDPVAVFQRPRIAFALARALWTSGRDRRRALDLAREARAAYASIPGARADLADVDAWLAARARR
ncbi:MAG TPA: serine/threonine-protein kinase [Kofleriaceae bacterium]|nr:serine/threonine-protein kinase [Kofleriaceae bacterium]